MEYPSLFVPGNCLHSNSYSSSTVGLTTSIDYVTPIHGSQEWLIAKPRNICWFPMLIIIWISVEINQRDNEHLELCKKRKNIIILLPPWVNLSIVLNKTGLIEKMRTNTFSSDKVHRLSNLLPVEFEWSKQFPYSRWMCFHGIII